MLVIQPVNPKMATSWPAVCVVHQGVDAHVSQVEGRAGRLSDLLPNQSALYARVGSFEIPSKSRTATLKIASDLGASEVDLAIGTKAVSEKHGTLNDNLTRVQSG